MALPGAPPSGMSDKGAIHRFQQPFWRRIAALVGLLVVGLAVLLALNPIPQDPAYHIFADRRPLLGIPNFNDVVSNAGFAAVGVLGILVIARRRRQIFTHGFDAWPYIVFFAGVALVSLGSAYYHWAPSNDRLLWDRLPMSIAFMAFCAAIIADRIDRKAGNTWLMLILVSLGILSLLHWHWTESQGHGDLRFYGFVQFFPLIAVPAVCWLFPQYRYVASRYIAWMIGWYGLSKLLEHFDAEVFDLLGHTVSGHTLKHLAAALATLVVLQMLLARPREAGSP
jgi:Ceramidase